MSETPSLPHSVDPAGGNRHEGRDWSVKTIFLVLAGIMAIVVVGLIAAGVAQRAFRRDRVAAEPPSLSGRVRVPPQPRLQSAPWRDLHAMVEAQERLLSSYGWIDRSRGVVRIPIDRAIDLALEEGFPVRGGLDRRGGRAQRPQDRPRRLDESYSGGEEGLK